MKKLELHHINPIWPTFKGKKNRTCDGNTVWLNMVFLGFHNTSRKASCLLSSVINV